MATSSHPLSDTNTESQPHPVPKTCLVVDRPPMPNIDWEALSPSQRTEETLKYLNNLPIPKFDWRDVPPAVPEIKIDVPQRVEELHKYLRENTYPAHTKNIMGAIEMYNRKELPKPGTTA